jgi:hypothetical protein
MAKTVFWTMLHVQAAVKADQQPLVVMADRAAAEHIPRLGALVYLAKDQTAVQLQVLRQIIHQLVGVVNPLLVDHQPAVAAMLVMAEMDWHPRLLGRL